MKIRSIAAASTVVGIAGGVIAMATAVLCRGFNPMSLEGWLFTGVVGCAGFGLMYGAAQWVIRKFVIYKIKPIYQIVLSRDIKTRELQLHLGRNRNLMGRMESELTLRTESRSRELERLKENEKYRREFLGNVSHEMKTPIFAIQGYILTLLDGAVDDPAVNRRYLERSEKSIDRMIDIVNDLDEISKLESGVLDLHKERFDIAQLAHDIVEEAAMEADKQSIRLLVGNTSGPHPPVWVVADRKYIEQVLTNLVINSIKYGHEGGRTRISFVDLFDKVMVEVSDNGIGLGPGEIPRVFERFYRSDKSRSREMGGSGLGLSIVKHIIEAHDEQISVRSQPEKGSTFSFTLSK